MVTGERRERERGMAVHRDDEGEVMGEQKGVFGVLIETRTKASGGRAGGQRQRRRVEGTEVRRRGALLLPVI